MNRIVLVGNGFDLANGLATRYEDFINWYWDVCFNNLKSCRSNTFTDDLCTFKINDESEIWYVYLWGRIDPINPPNGRSFYEYLKHEKETFTIKNSPFMERICQSVDLKGWVDIEDEYYRALKEEYFNIPEILNKELEILKSKLIEYLTFIQKKNIKESIVKQELKNQIFSSININEVAISARSLLISFIRNRYEIPDGIWDNAIYKRFDSDKKGKDIQSFKKFSEAWGSQIEYMSIESVIDNDVIPDVMLYPDRIMLLNFNYTDVADLYFPLETDDRYYFPINHIHGELSIPESIIFGYGDELDDRYKDIVKLNNNEHLKNIKSIRYLERPDYRKMLAFIDSAPYQIYIMGHSCGNSDRTLLNTLFEHKNCISIKPFYYEREDGSDNYLEIIQNISRNFTDMKLMRDRVVNKKYCESM